MSAIIGGLIPKIEGFQPIPNSVMIPFMEAQSAALAYGFGLNYEYGKRKIRSMSNEEFNSLTSEQITNMSNEHTHIILSKFQAQVPTVMPMQHEIFKQYVEIEKAKVIQNVELAKWLAVYAKEGLDDATAHLLGGHIHRVDPDQTYIDPNNPDKDFAPPTGQPPAATTPSNKSQDQAQFLAAFNSAQALEQQLIKIHTARMFQLSERKRIASTNQAQADIHLRTAEQLLATENQIKAKLTASAKVWQALASNFVKTHGTNPLFK